MRIILYAVIAFIVLFSSLTLSAQNGNLKGTKNEINSNTYKGTVKDFETKLPLAYCNVIVLNTSIGTSTDEKGKFKLVIPRTISPVKLMIAYVGYKTDTIEVNPSKTNYPILLNALQHGLNEVVITARTREESLKEDPTSIKTIKPKIFEQATESNLVDLLAKHVPGMSVLNTGPNVSKPFIHGLGYNRIETNYDNVPVEGQQFEDEEVLPIDMYNIERAEVVLGPICLMDGPDALAGMVSLIPSMPGDTMKVIHGKLLSEYQSNNGLIGNGLRLTYGNKHWAYAVRGSYRIAKNYTNSIDGRVYNTGFCETNASGTVVYTRNSGFSSLNFTMYDDLQGIPDGSRDSATRKFTEPIYDGSQDNITARPIVPDNELNSYALSPVHQHIQHYRVYSNNHYSFRNNSYIDGMVSFQQNVRREYDFPENQDLLGVSLKLNSWNYDFRYHLVKISNIESAVGLNGMYQTNTNINANDIPIPDYNLFDIGSFIFAKWKYKKWSVSSGVGYNHRHVSGDNFYTRQDTINDLVQQVTPPDTMNANLLFPAFSKNFDGLSADIGATYRVNEHVNIKANIARGSGAPHISEFASNGLDGSAHAYYIGKSYIVPEYNLQEDVGTGVNFKDFDASISIYNNNLEDYIYLVEVVNANGQPLEVVPGNKTYQYQQGPAQIYGMESTLNIHPGFIKGFSFNNYFSLLYGFNLNPAYKNKGVNGEYLPLMPTAKLFSSLMQDFKVRSRNISHITAKIESDINAAQNRYLALNQTETATPAYTLINAGVIFFINYTKKMTLQLQLQVNNIFDEAYQSNLSRLKYFEYYSYSPNGHYGIYGMGRNICGKVILPF